MDRPHAAIVHHRHHRAAVLEDLVRRVLFHAPIVTAGPYYGNVVGCGQDFTDC